MLICHDAIAVKYKELLNLQKDKYDVITLEETREKIKKENELADPEADEKPISEEEIFD